MSFEDDADRELRGDQVELDQLDMFDEFPGVVWSPTKLAWQIVEQWPAPAPGRGIEGLVALRDPTPYERTVLKRACEAAGVPMHVEASESPVSHPDFGDETLVGRLFRHGLAGDLIRFRDDRRNRVAKSRVVHVRVQRKRAVRARRVN